jgi:hypothetical protein
MAARLAGIEPFRWGIRPGEGWRRSRGLPIADLWPQMGGGVPVGGRPAAPREHSRGGPYSGEVAARPGKSVVRKAPEDPRVAPEWFGEHRRRVEGKLGDGGVPGRQWRACARAGTAGRGLNSRTSGVASSLSDEGPPALLRGTASASTGALGRRTDDGPLGRARRRYGAAPDAARVPRTAGAKGTHDPDLEALGSESARTPRWRGGRRAAQPGRQNARRAGGALERGRAVFQPVNATLTAFFFKKLNRSAQSGE